MSGMGSYWCWWQSLSIFVETFLLQLEVILHILGCTCAPKRNHLPIFLSQSIRIRNQLPCWPQNNMYISCNTVLLLCWVSISPNKRTKPFGRMQLSFSNTGACNISCLRCFGYWRAGVQFKSLKGCDNCRPTNSIFEMKSIWRAFLVSVSQPWQLD